MNKDCLPMELGNKDRVDHLADSGKFGAAFAVLVRSAAFRPVEMPKIHSEHGHSGNAISMFLHIIQYWSNH
jgi:hypothetical protein